MSGELNIDRGIPIPPAAKFGPRVGKYPYEKMEVGDSFLVTFSDEAGAAIAKRRMRQSTAWANRRHAPKRFTARAVSEGVRVWRIA